MTSSESPSAGRLRPEPEKLLPFRSDVHVSAAGEVTLKAADFSGLRGEDAKVSEYGLERYLNACSPTCHG
jgi:hypothetical protein